jgi:S-adenosylmethionine uptake transporter
MANAKTAQHRGFAMQSLWMIAAGFLFAAMGVCIKYASAAGASPAEIIFYRSAISFALMLFFLRASRIPLKTPHWRFQLNRGIAGFSAMTLNFWAIVLLPLGTAMTLNYTSPIFLVALLAFTHALRMTGGVWLSLGAGFLGVACILQPHFAANQWLGGALGLSSGVLAAYAYYNLRELGAKGEPDSRTVFYFSLISLIGGFFLWLAFGIGWPTWPRLAALLGVGAFATLAQGAMTRAYARGRALLSATLAYTAVIFACGFEFVLWDKALDGNEILGIALIGISGVLAHRFSRAPRK